MASASVTGARHFSLLLTCGFGVFLGAAWGRVHPGVPSSRECLAVLEMTAPPSPSSLRWSRHRLPSSQGHWTPH